MQNKLAPLGARICETEAIYDIIETTFEQHEQIGAGNASLSFGPFKKQVKLFFRKPVHSFDLLLFTQLNSVIGNFPASPLAMLSRRI
jgi:hypothetical protein